MYKIMIVDDDPLIVDSTRELLEEEYDVRGYVSARDALEELEKNKYDLLILDYLMDQFNGDVFIEKLRKFDSQIFIILYTGQAELVPPLQTIRSFQIQGYVEKGDANKLLIALESSFKALEQVKTIKRYNIGLNKVIGLNKKILKIQTFKEVINSSAHGLLEICGNGKIKLVFHDIIKCKKYIVDICTENSNVLDIQVEDTGEFGLEEYTISAVDAIKIQTADGKTVGAICLYYKLDYELLDVLKIYAMQIGLSISNSILYNKSITDGLTRVYNRMFFEQYIELMILEYERYKKKFSFLLIDLDHFKDINDKFGHQSGDDVLVYFANFVRNILRKPDVIARYGGEEFAIVLKNTDKDAALKVAEKIRRQIENHKIIIDDKQIVFTISIGVTDYSTEDGWHGLIKRADQALYSAKNSGRNKCVKI